MLEKVILKESGSASNNIELDLLDWICENCFNAIVYPSSSGKWQSKYILAHNKILEHALEDLHADGVCMINTLMDMYRDYVIELYDENICKNELECFRKLNRQWVDIYHTTLVQSQVAISTTHPCCPILAQLMTLALS